MTNVGEIITNYNEKQIFHRFTMKTSKQKNVEKIGRQSKRRTKKIRKETSFIQYVETFEISFLTNIEFLSYDISRIFFYSFVY